MTGLLLSYLPEHEHELLTQPHTLRAGVENQLICGRYALLQTLLPNLLPTLTPVPWPWACHCIRLPLSSISTSEC